MKVYIFESTYHDLRCVRALAIIGKSKKKGIPRKFQKTWSLTTVAPQFTIKELRPSIEAEAKRWEQTVLARIKRDSESKSENGNPDIQNWKCDVCAAKFPEVTVFKKGDRWLCWKHITSENTAPHHEASSGS